MKKDYKLKKLFALFLAVAGILGIAMVGNAQDEAGKIFVKKTATKIYDATAKDNLEKGRFVTAICGAPAVVLGKNGYLKNKKAVCYPGFETMMQGCDVVSQPVAIDGNVITANGPAAAGAFALAIIGETLGSDASQAVAQGLLLKEKNQNSEYYY